MLRIIRETSGMFKMQILSLIFQSSPPSKVFLIFPREKMHRSDGEEGGGEEEGRRQGRRAAGETKEACGCHF